MTLSVVTENHAAHHVYQKVGFVDEGRLRQVFRRDGQWYDMFRHSCFSGVWVPFPRATEVESLRIGLPGDGVRS